MLRFSDPTHFNFPLANRPADQLDWHARNVWYRSDLPVITPVSLSVNFGNVPENLTTHRPVQFEVRRASPSSSGSPRRAVRTSASRPDRERSSSTTARRSTQ